MIYDVNTNNKSFLEMAYFLKTQGIKNNKFMLALNDPDLSGVDVYSPNLTAMQKTKIYTECCINWWYFLREVAKVPEQGSNTGVSFQLNVGNMAAAYCCNHNVSHILILPRQVGKTVVEVTFSVWAFYFAATYSKETYLHKAQSGSVDNLKRFKDYKELLPDWLQHIIATSGDKDNLEEKESKLRHNTIVALSSAANDSAADKLGRGSSTPMVYFDEFAFLERNDIVWAALIPAWATASGVAKRNGSPYGIRITTTPNNLSLPQAQFCYFKIMQRAYRFAYSFYDIPIEEIDDFVSKNSDNDFVYIEYTWQECGKSKDWYVAQCRKNPDRTIIKRELENVWPEASEGSIFTEQQLDLIKYYVKPAVTDINVNGYQISFFENPDLRMNYILSCDVSGGLSLDRSVMAIIHPEDFHIVGLFVNARISTDAFYDLIYAVATNYFIHSIINIENNSYGLAILDRLVKTTLEPRLYCEYVERQGEKILESGTVVKQKRKKLVYGTNTNNKSRDLMYQMLPCIVDDEPEVFISDQFYSEIKNLCRVKNKVEARQGAHDDIIMAYLITRYSIAYGNGFKDRFGIMPIKSKANIHDGHSTLNNISSSFVNILDDVNTINNNNVDLNRFVEEVYETSNNMIDKDIEDGYAEGKRSTNIYSLIDEWNKFTGE